MNYSHWKGCRIVSLWSLLPVATGALGVSVMLSACGGGGGGSLELSLDDIRMIALTNNALIDLQEGDLFGDVKADAFSPPSCAQVSQNGDETVVNFGNGCSSSDRTYAGRVRYRMEGFDPEDETYARLSLTFENLRIERQEPSQASLEAVEFNGTYTVETWPPDRFFTQRVICDLTMRVKPQLCNIRIRLDRNFVREGNLTRIITSMNYVSPATGDLTLTTQYTTDSNRPECSFQPVSGSGQLRYKGRTLIVSYDGTPCYKARVTLNGKTQEVDLRSLLGFDDDGDDDSDDDNEYRPVEDPCVADFRR